MIDGQHQDIAFLVERIDARLADLLPPMLANQRVLHTAMRDSVLAPGKRLRPLMVLIVAEDLGGSSEAAIDAGCALEMVHAASLILDDLPCMDDAELRRGRPTTHRSHGEDVAVLAAIGILSQAFGTLSRMVDVPAAARAECVAILSDAVGAAGLVAGQFQDLRGGALRPTDISSVNGLKTGSLFSAAASLGAVIAGASPQARRDLEGFAAELGLAFQLLDDFLDLRSDALVLGKDVGQDNGKPTLIALIGEAEAERQIDRHLDAVRRHLTAVFGPQSRLQSLVDRAFKVPNAVSRPLAEPTKREAKVC